MDDPTVHVLKIRKSNGHDDFVVSSQCCGSITACRYQIKPQPRQPKNKQEETTEARGHLHKKKKKKKGQVRGPVLVCGGAPLPPLRLCWFLACDRTQVCAMDANEIRARKTSRNWHYRIGKSRGSSLCSQVQTQT